MIRLITTKRLIKRLDHALEDGLKIGRHNERLAIINIIRNKVCFDNKKGKGCEHQSCYELIDVLNQIGERIKW